MNTLLTTRLFAVAVAASAASLVGSPTLPAQEPLRRDAERDTRHLPEVRLLSADGRSAVFEYRPRFLDRQTVSVAGTPYALFDFEGSIVERSSENIGFPDLRLRHIPVGLPGRDGAAVRIVADDFEDIPGIDILPIPRNRVNDGLVEEEKTERDPAAYSVSSFQPQSVASLLSVDQARSLHIGIVRIAPVQYNAATRTVRRHTRIRIEVLYGPATSTRVEKSDYDLFANGLINAPSARLWVGARAKVAAVAPTPSVLASGTWYRLTVKDDGIYKLDAQYLAAAGISTSSLDPQTIRIFGNGGADLPEDITRSRPVDLTELLIYVEGEGDHRFDASDYVLFYGRGPRGWQYDPSARALRHYINHYTDENYYWLNVGTSMGKRMPARPSESQPPDVIAERFADGVFAEEERFNLLRSGKDWYGQLINGPTGSFTYVNALPGIVPGESITYRYALASHAGVSATYTVRENGSVIGAHMLGPIVGYIYARAGTYQVSGSSTLPNNTSQLNFGYSASDIGSEGYIDWVEILYPRMLWAVNEALRFRSPDTAAVVEYRLQQFSSLPMVFDVTKHDSVVRITGVEGAYTFRSREQSGGVSEYCAAGAASWKSPLAIQHMSNQDLRGFADGADFVIITSKEFRPAADRLKEHRQLAAYGGVSTIVADVDQIYNEFGGGIPDITAIRDYLKYAYDTWLIRPSFVLFFGQASYDYKGTLGSKSSYVPTWQSLESRDDVASYATDDFFVMFGRSFALSIVPGRLGVRTPAEAEAVVDRIKRYETSSVQDLWKMRMLFIGDDSWTTEREDGTLHTRDAEVLSNPVYTPDEFEKKKIYIAEYPTVNTSQGRRKPEAAQAIIDQINEGVLILNYSGHGNPSVWAHERIFEVGASIPQLVNVNRLSLFFLATCNFSQFDDPKIVSGSELLMNSRKGGAVGVISAARKVYAGANAALNQGTYRQLFVRDAYGRVVVDRPARALFLYKNLSGNGDNDQKFFYMGDPTMRLAFPRGFASIDSINGAAVDSANGVPRQELIPLRSLSRVNVTGMVRNPDNTVGGEFNGKASVVVNDASQTRTIVNFYEGVNYDYLAPGGTIFRGELSVANGRFAGTFVVPKDIQYADSTASGRLVAYIAGGGTDAAAYTGLVHVGGTDTTAGTDTEGPQIQIFLENRSFRPGDLVTENPMLYADFKDASGINTSVSGVGHRIEAWIDRSLQSVDLTPSYASALDDYREGSVAFPLRNLAPGHHEIRVRAWDSYNNSSVAESRFDVASSASLTIGDVFNYPNPFTQSTEFTFRQNLGEPLQVTVKVYTVAGRLIQTLETTTVGELFVRVPWDGRDRDGDQIANGIYLYKVIARTLDGRFSSEALGKLSIVR